MIMSEEGRRGKITIAWPHLVIFITLSPVVFMVVAGGQEIIFGKSTYTVLSGILAVGFVFIIVARHIFRRSSD